MKEYLTVTKLNQYIKSQLESDFLLSNVTLIGEVSGFTNHYTGHLYFTLKDENSQIKCMMFSSYASKMKFNIKNGDLILIHGYVGVYDKGGTYQLYCRNIEPYGEGQYLLNLEKLKQRLIDEGVLNRPKKKIPLIPNKIALITAKTGAAVHDYLTTIKKRVNTSVYVFPSMVQGEDAPKSILEALKTSLKINPDLIVITRGGGSKEDLKAFNDEALVRFIADIDIPLISAVGHQIDTTLIDYVSDLRCITPTDAAVNSVPSYEDIISRINILMNKMHYLIDKKISSKMEKIMLISNLIENKSPLNLSLNLKQKILNYSKIVNLRINSIVENRYNNMKLLCQKFNNLYYNYANRYSYQINNIISRLAYLDPNLKLEKGYAKLIKDKMIVNSIEDLNINDSITIELKGGIIEANIINIKKGAKYGK